MTLLPYLPALIIWQGASLAGYLLAMRALVLPGAYRAQSGAARAGASHRRTAARLTGGLSRRAHPRYTAHKNKAENRPPVPGSAP
ncbi:MAG: hypothetical protein P8Y71_02250 [Pseudolabrys sp.]